MSCALSKIYVLVMKITTLSHYHSASLHERSVPSPFHDIYQVSSNFFLSSNQSSSSSVHFNFSHILTLSLCILVGQAGFIATQYHKSEGTTLTLWQYKSDGSNKILSLMSIINLPLSPQRKPEVSYDGKRLIVFGQDHIGLVILVYHVLSTVEDQEASKCKAQYGKDSGGIINLKATNPRVRYVNRIRHAGKFFSFFTFFCQNIFSLV